ncbi:MAG: NAD-dependent epimerase/dehydratase family protein [Chloroflexi bacterium]|nr:MAG: NAD-dependent epimerase/dehydratase family protein [Chloroflexota bacterium]
MKSLVTWIKKAVSFQGAVRLLADAILINLAILMSLAARLLWIVATGKTEVSLNYRVTFWDYWGVYKNNAWLLTLICLTLFILNGFYTYGRFYRGRYKVVIVIQAVSLAYIIFGFLTYLTQSNFMGFLTRLLNFPRGTLILSWALSTVMLLVARVWATIWKNVIKSESSRSRQAEGRGVNHVLVIGGAGYIGSTLLPRLLDKGYNVRLLDLLLYGTEPIKEWLNHPRLEIMRADFRQVEKVVQAMHGMDAVIHLGGLVGDSACALNEELTLEINLMATRMIAEVAKGSGVGRFIFTSTCSVYGANDQMLDERSELRPVSLYARSKIASERVLLKLAADSFAPVILRLSTIYGLSGRPRFDLVINLLTAKAVVDHEITIFGGDQCRPFLHVDDAARAIASVLEAPLQIVRNQIFNVGSNEQNYKISQVGEIIHGLVPGAAVVNKDDITDARNYWVNSNKIKQALGFSPEWTVERGVEQVIEAIHSGKVRDYRDAKYSNIKFLKEEGIYLLTNNESSGVLGLLNEESVGALLQDEG